MTAQKGPRKRREARSRVREGGYDAVIGSKEVTISTSRNWGIYRSDRHIYRCDRHICRWDRLHSGRIDVLGKRIFCFVRSNHPLTKILRIVSNGQYHLKKTIKRTRSYKVNSRFPLQNDLQLRLTTTFKDWYCGKNISQEKLVDWISFLQVFSSSLLFLLRILVLCGIFVLWSPCCFFLQASFFFALTFSYEPQPDLANF